MELDFIDKRGQRMLDGLKNDPAYSAVAPLFYEEDLNILTAANQDRYAETLDEVIDVLRSDERISLSTEGLRASSYKKGYVRYVNIDEFSCSLLYDQDNWSDHDSVSTPFWLGIKRSGWKLTPEIRDWMKKYPSNHVSSTWNTQPCIALIPLVGKNSYEVCVDLAEQIIGLLNQLKKELG